MKTMLLLVVVCGVFLLGAVMHEADIQRQCAEVGTVGYSGWLGNFSCQPIK